MSETQPAQDRPEAVSEHMSAHVRLWPSRRAVLWLVVRCAVAAPFVVVVVAWALALTIDQSAAASRAYYLDMGDGWVVRTHVSPGTMRQYWDRRTPVTTTPGVPTWGAARRTRPDPSLLEQQLYIEVAWGWPMPAMWYHYDRLGTSWNDRRSVASPAIDLGDATRGIGRQAIALPLGIAWRGFVVNTLVFALVLSALGVGVSRLRAIAFLQRRRANAGLCAQCGYDLRGGAPDAPCPECGAARDVSPGAPATSPAATATRE